MRYKYRFLSLVIASLLGTTVLASARPMFRGAISPDLVSPATPPSWAQTMGNTPSLGVSSINEPGVPNTSTPGIIGTGASPSGLPGDSLSAPGFPSIVGAR